MSSMNKVILLGRLGGAPEKRYTQGGKAITKFSLATDSGFGENRSTDWHKVVAFDRAAENCAEHLHKGSLVLVEGRISYNKWEKDDGTTQWFTEIIANWVTFLDGTQSGGSQQRDDRRGDSRDNQRGGDSRDNRRGGRGGGGGGGGGQSHDDFRRDGFSDRDIPF